MDGRLRNLKKRSKKTAAAFVILAIILLFLLLYYVGNGFHFTNDYIINTSEDLRVVIDSPSHDEVFYTGDSIEVTGSVWGEIPWKVYVWDERYNVPIFCPITASRFGVELYATDLSTGYHTLCVQVQANNGKWSAVETVRIQKKASGSEVTGYMATGTTWVETNLPSPLGIVFRPVEEVLRSVIVYVSGGTAPDDLNGDNIPDEIQQSVVSPRYNPMNLPLTALIVFALIIGVILVLILYIGRPYIQHKQRREREIRRTPEQRAWVMDIEQLKNKELRAKLKAEERRRKALEMRVKQEQQKRVEAQAQRPVHIYLTGDKKAKNLKNIVKKGEK